MLDFVVGHSTAMATEWARKSAAGDANPLATYLMLLNQTITDAQTSMGTVAAMEVSGTGYARQQVLWSAASTRAIANSDALSFGPFADASGLSAPVVSACLVTTLTGNLGLVLMNWTLTSPITTVQNQALQIAAGSLSMSLGVS
ncbi:hypothetical protein [Streptomyces sp. CBMA29]|uniref:phage tail fiber protein n=1 Tax=Streptomyces sp. CBMA29 TaxID=1896314 RepID=UPI001661E931|nr:hypothetical protein [Streptomyces sp. CBMA29]